MNRVEAGDYHEFSRLSHPAVSPDGERVAYVKQAPDSDTDYEATVHVASVGGDESRRFTVAEGVDSEPTWSPSGDRLAFVSTRGASDDRPHLWVLPVDGGEAEQVTDVVGGVSNIAWGPDGDRIAFVQSVRPEERERDLDLDTDEEYEREDPDPRVIDRHVYRADESYADGARSHAYLVDLEGNEVSRVTEGVADCLGPAWGADALYYPIRRGVDADDRLEWELAAVDPATGEETVVTTVEGWGPKLAAHAGDEGDRIAYTTRPADDPTLSQIEVDVYNRASGDVERVTADLDRTLELWNPSHAPAWSPDGDYLYVCTPDEGGYALRRIDDDGVEVVLGGDRHVHGFSVARDAVGVVQSEWDHPGDVVAATPGGAEENRLTRVNADYLDDRAVGQPQELQFEAPDGEKIQGWVLTPPDFDPDEEYPLVVEIHGGPHRMWSTTGSMWHEFQTLAARGYVVFWCNPRGSAGYGEAFMRAIERDWGDATLQDVLAGAREVADRDYVADDAFVTGGSFGGFMTAWAVGHTDFFDAAVAQRGVYDLTGFYGSTDVFQLVEGDFRAVPWADYEFLAEQSPATYADLVDTPTLVVHAEDDYRTPANTAELFYRALKRQDVDTRLVRYPREGHELSRSGEPGHVVDRIERIARWFDGYAETQDAPRALDRERGDGLSVGEDEA
ncbi:acylaminoacyl-peptidase [Halobacterium sp. DL1]|jgi:dipeptidyl aminopeptidase/acylaminoacyl peptidase|nr:acylaminoacyl-peptidase [Halobacterium sp. DL1]